MILEQLIFTILAFGIFVYMFFKMIKENDREKSSSIARELVRKSGFDIQDNAESLRNIYLN